MSDLSDLPGFEYGFPLEPEKKWFGLWCPLFDCFLLVGHNFEILQKIQTLSIGKIITIIIKLDYDLCENKIIDNTCTTNWTLAEHEILNFTMVTKLSFHNDKTYSIVPKNVTNLEEIKKVQVWLIFLMRWIKYIELSLSEPIIDFTGFILEDYTASQLQRQIYQVLLLEDQPTQAEAKINQLLGNYDQDYWTQLRVSK
jgi:hypothetical protein